MNEGILFLVLLFLSNFFYILSPIVYFEGAFVMPEQQEEITRKKLPSRQRIHDEIEQKLISKLFTIVENIEETPDGRLNFEPYDDRTLIQIEAFLDKKFEQKVFRHKKDPQISTFLKLLKREREDRDFGFDFK